MHYIRFFRVPQLQCVRSTGLYELTAKLTITTDLGEYYLTADVELEVILDPLGRSALPGGKSNRYTWTGRSGMRCLTITVPTPTNCQSQVTMLVRTVDSKYAVVSFASVLQASRHGGIASVRSLPIDLGVLSRSIDDRFAIRTYATSSGEIRVEEETGESIARHIWDAGVVLSAYVSEVAPYVSRSSSAPSQLPSLPKLQSFLCEQDLKILELGAGCGIVGLTMARCLPNISNLILTDLDEAMDILRRNVSSASSVFKEAQTAVSYQVLDWSLPLSSEIAATRWNLVVVADCTYNPDVVPDLVKTLSSLRAGSKDLMVLLAMKVRHESEMVFFDLMSEDGWVVEEKCKVPLSMVGDEDDQEIEIFVFK